MNRINVAVNSLTNDDQGSVTYHLAMITAVRKLIDNFRTRTDIEENVKYDFKIKLLIDTDLRQVLHKILVNQSSQEEVYFLKLEALWIYVNFSVEESDVVKYILD